MKTPKYLNLLTLILLTLVCSLVGSANAAEEPEALYLFAPIQSTETYLMNRAGAALYTWTSNYTPGNAVYLLENGNLLRTGMVRNGAFDVGGAGGVVQEIAPDSSIVWEYRLADENAQLHHDIEPLPNGNILMIAWERKTQAEAIAAGRDPSLLQDGELWPGYIFEVDPAANEIVWEWHAWDHLVQDYAPAQANYGVVNEHTEKIDLNFTSAQANADWLHINSIDYNAELDQISLSVHNFSEVWVIDHGAAPAQADLLYRWGNPQTHGAGTTADQQLFAQHDAQWIAAGLPGAGNMLIFNNGARRTRPYSSVEEITPPLNANGSYTLEAGTAYTPAAPAWNFTGDFFAQNISGAQRLANGNTLICNGPDGIFYEVTSQGEIVWEYNYGGGVFRVTKISADDPRLSGLNLIPGETLIAEAGAAGQTPGVVPASGQGGPPQRALDACTGLAADASCSFEGQKGTVSGSCKNQQNQLVCAPQNKP
ncbi:MAG: arylsulfotransferase (ASST) [Chloroflexi bacterium]|nr:arylsulfotransferase (ASST) [Chloroflexota bacterium]